MIDKFRKNEKGQGLVEFALVFPLFLFLFLGMIDYSHVNTANTQLTNATQEAAKEFAHLADTPEYQQWYIEDQNKPVAENRINNDLKELVAGNVNTVPADNISVVAERTTDDEGGLGDRVVVKVRADVPSLSQFSFKKMRIERQVTLRIPTVR